MRQEAPAYVVEVRSRGGKDWRPIKAYLSRSAAIKKAERAAWEDHVETRVCVYDVLPEETIYTSVETTQ